MILDVTNKESIKKACDEIARTNGTLYGVVLTFLTDASDLMRPCAQRSSI